MSPEQIGFVVGAIIAVLIIPVGILVIGYVMSRNQLPEERKVTRKRVNLAAIIVAAGVSVLVALIFVVPIGGGTNVGQMRAGMIRGCTNRCIQRTKQEDACRKMCTCVSDRFIKDVGEQRIAAMNSPKDMTSQDRAKLIGAALHCRRHLQKPNKQ